MHAESGDLALHYSTTNMKIFLSYAREDSGAANEVYSFLSEMGLRPWQDTRELLAGQNWLTEIEANIRESDLFILFMSKHLEKDSNVLRFEMDIALETEKSKETNRFIFPVRVDSECKFAEENHRQWLDLRDSEWRFKIMRSIAERLDESCNTGIATILDEGSLVLKTIYKETILGMKDCIQAELPHFYIPKARHASREIHTLVHGQIWQKIMKFRTLAFDDWEPNPGETSTFNLTSVPTIVDSAFLSVRFEYSEYFHGRPYPNMLASAFSLFIDELTEVSCYRIFKNDNEYPLPFGVIELIARGAYDGTATSAESIIAHLGSTARTSDFDCFIVTKSGLRFYFSRSQIGGGALGAPIVDISAEDLKPYLKETGLTERLMAIWKQNFETQLRNGPLPISAQDQSLHIEVDEPVRLLAEFRNAEPFGIEEIDDVTKRIIDYEANNLEAPPISYQFLELDADTMKLDTDMARDKWTNFIILVQAYVRAYLFPNVYSTDVKQAFRERVHFLLMKNKEYGLFHPYCIPAAEREVFDEMDRVFKEWRNLTN